MTTTSTPAEEARNPDKSEVYKFDDCVLDAGRRELRQSGEIVTLQPKAFELLLYLVRNRHRAVDKNELQDVLWPRSIVTETALTRCVMKARRAVGDDADRQYAIKTVHGHGYRFVADIDEAEEPAAAITNPTASAPAATGNWKPAVLGGVAAALVALLVGAWFILSPTAIAGPVRMAVLPIENATGDDDANWMSTGLMALMNRMLEDGGLETVDSQDVSNLAGDEEMSRLLAAGSEFRARIRRTTAATHIVGTRIERASGLYRLTYVLAGIDQRPIRRTMVGKDPTELVRDAVSTLSALLTNEPAPEIESQGISNDSFLNEVYARGMALYHEGRYQDALELFDIIIEQESHLFWPRYERALSLRNLRDHAAAESELRALRGELDAGDQARELSAVENALGVMYLNQQRYAEARAAFAETIRLADVAEDRRRKAIGMQNFGLLEKNLGNLEPALERMQAAEATYESMDIEILPGTLHNNMSGLLIQLGHIEEAERRSKQAIEAFKFTGERKFESYALSRLSSIYLQRHDYQRAAEINEQSLLIRRELDDQFGIASSLINIADIEIRRGNYSQAMQNAQQAFDIGTMLEDRRIASAALLRLARCEAHLGSPEAARSHYATLEAKARSVGDAHDIFRARLGLADVHTRLGEYDEAAAIGEAILGEARTSNRRREETAALRVFADIELAQQRYDEAIGILMDALAIAEGMGDTASMASIHRLLADTFLRKEDAAAAAPHVAFAAAERPEDFATMKIQARYEFLSGNPQAAIEFMTEARSRAGQAWTTEDDAVLASYRVD